MLKRICDKCGKEVNSDKFWFRIDCDKMNGGVIYCGAGVYEFCEKCFNDFKAQLANNN